MITLVLHWVINALALFIVSKIIPGIVVSGFGAALLAAIVIGLVNTLLRPILLLLTLPVTILTLGLFTFVVNALLLLLAGSITPGFSVDGFGTAIVGSILLSIVSTLLHSLAQ